MSGIESITDKARLNLVEKSLDVVEHKLKLYNAINISIYVTLIIFGMIYFL